MFLGPLSATKPWSTKGIEGVFRFLNKIWRMILDEDGKVNSKIKDVPPDTEQEIVMNRTIKKVTEDIEDNDMKFNTCVSELMIYVNEISKYEVLPRILIVNLIKLLTPFAPHISEELWEMFGCDGIAAYAKWPDFDPDKVAKKTVVVVGQVNGKVRTKVDIDLDADDKTLLELIKSDEKIRSYIEGKEIIKEIVVKNKLVNIVVR
jgi:leucyl-tRNA synthetase